MGTNTPTPDTKNSSSSISKLPMEPSNSSPDNQQFPLQNEPTETPQNEVPRDDLDFKINEESTASDTPKVADDRPINFQQPVVINSSNPENKKNRKLINIVLPIFGLVVIIIGFLLFKFKNNLPLVEHKATDSKSASKSILGYIPSISDKQIGDVEIIYQSSSNPQISLKGSYVATNNSVYLDVLSRREHINQLLEVLYKRGMSPEEPGQPQFSVDDFGIPQFSQLDVASLLNLDYFLSSKNLSDNIIGGVYFEDIDSCPQAKELRDFVKKKDYNLSHFPLIEENNNYFKLDTSQIKDEYFQYVNRYVDSCLLSNPSVHESDRAIYTAFKDNITQLPEVKIKHETINGVEQLTIDRIINNTSSTLVVKLNKTDDKVSKKVEKSKYMFDREMYFGLMMEACRHAPVVALDNSYQFVTMSELYFYPTPFDSRYTCSTRDPLLQGHSAGTTSSILGNNGTYVTINESAIDELIKHTEIYNALEEYFLVNGKYPATDEVNSLQGKFLKQEDLFDHEKKPINQGALKYESRNENRGYRLSYTLGQLELNKYEYGSTQ